MTAAFDAEYAGTEFWPVLPIPRPAIEAVVRTRERLSLEAFLVRRGMNLVLVVSATA